MSYEQAKKVSEELLSLTGDCIKERATGILKLYFDQAYMAALQELKMHGLKPGMHQVHYEGVSGRQSLQLQVFMNYEGVQTENMKKTVFHHSSNMVKEFMAEMTAIDPQSIEAKKDWLIKAAKCFVDAGYPSAFFEEIPNQYCGPLCCPHMVGLNVTTAIGIVQIGWRKRVLNIDWTETVLSRSGAELFPDEDVTKSSGSYGDEKCYIHAYGYEKATKYLKVILETAVKEYTQS